MKYDEEFEQDWRDMKAAQREAFDPVAWILFGIAAALVLMLMVWL